MQFIDDAMSAETLKNEKKKELKEKTFADVDKHIISQSIQSLVDKRVAAEVKKVLNTAQKSKKVSPSTNCNKHFLTHIISVTEESIQSNNFLGPKSGCHWKRRQ